MELHIDAPREVRAGIAERLRQHKTLEAIERRVRAGMLVAMDEIREQITGVSAIESGKFKGSSAREIRGLQLIYNFLADRGMTYTLSCLLEESTVRRSRADTDDISDLIIESRPVFAKTDCGPTQEPVAKARGKALDKGGSGVVTTQREFYRNPFLISVDDL